MDGCDEVRSELVAWLDGELPAEATLAVAAHVAACQDCRGEAESLRAVWRALDAVTVSAAPAGAAARVAAAVLSVERTEPAADETVARAWRARLIRLLPVAAAVAAAVLLTLGLWWAIGGAPLEGPAPREIARPPESGSPAPNPSEPLEVQRILASRELLENLELLEQMDLLEYYDLLMSTDDEDLESS